MYSFLSSNILQKEKLLEHCFKNRKKTEKLQFHLMYSLLNFVSAIFKMKTNYWAENNETYICKEIDCLKLL